MKHAIIMGASSGIGREVAALLLADGWRVGIAARRMESLMELKATAGDMVEVEQIDVTEYAAADRLLALAERLGDVDLYFHAAGVGWQNTSLDMNKEMKTVETNVKGFMLLVDTMFRYMTQRGGGHIAVISSIAGTKGLGPAPAYSATKAFQNTYIQALEQLAYSKNTNVKFTDIRPGFVDTDLLKDTHYPLLMDKKRVASMILKAVYSNRHICVIDGRYRVLTSLWRLIPNAVWRRLKLIR